MIGVPGVPLRLVSSIRAVELGHKASSWATRRLLKRVAGDLAVPHVEAQLLDRPGSVVDGAPRHPSRPSVTQPVSTELVTLTVVVLPGPGAELEQGRCRRRRARSGGTPGPAMNSEWAARTVVDRKVQRRVPRQIHRLQHVAPTTWSQVLLAIVTFIVGPAVAGDGPRRNWPTGGPRPCAKTCCDRCARSDAIGPPPLANSPSESAKPRSPTIRACRCTSRCCRSSRASRGRGNRWSASRSRAPTAASLPPGALSACWPVTVGGGRGLGPKRGRRFRPRSRRRARSCPPQRHPRRRVSLVDHDPGPSRSGGPELNGDADPGDEASGA